MRRRLTPWRVRAAILVALVGPPALLVVAWPEARADKPATPAKQAWTLDEALAQLAVYPRDPYLQYVALQLGHREKRPEAADRVAHLLGDEARERRAARRDRVDLFSVFSGALAVQESLQLDTMRGRDRNEPKDDAAEKRRKEIVDIDKLTGPTIKSHPWAQMLAGRKPDVGTLARAVPDDCWYVESRSPSKLLDLLDAGDLWKTHLFNQAARAARSQDVGERIRRQLAVETNRLLRPIYDAVIEEIAATGSDLFLAEGSDVTLLYRARQADLLKARMDGFLADAQKARPDAKRSEAEHVGVAYVHLTTPERDLHVFSAYPEPNLHIRSNSKAGFFRVLESLTGKSKDGKAVRRLGETDEYQYIRTLMPRGAKEEDVFAYLSDPFIRRLVGPEVKLTERRRMLCYNHLRMIAHAALLFRTEHGRTPKSLQELAEAKCCIGKFNEGDLACFDGGAYALSADGCQGVCSHHGHAQNLIPCGETPLVWVNGLEADEYKAFLTEYSSYWRTFFDPIAVRAQVTAQKYRLETIVLPLIDNSLYMGLSKALGGKPEPLDALPVPKRNIFSVNARIDKAGLLKDAKEEIAGGQRDLQHMAARELGIPEKDAEAIDFVKLLTEGLGNQVGLHVCDAAPVFDFDLVGFLGLMAGTFNGNANIRGVGMQELSFSFLIASLNAPVYIAVPVQDAKVVDEFLEQLDKVLPAVARRSENITGWLRFGQDFFMSKMTNGQKMRAYSLSLGPVKWRFFWARIGGGLYVASKPFLLEDLVAAEAGNKEAAPADGDTTGHAVIRLRPKNWKEVLPDYRLAWAENNRQACLANLGPLSSVARAVAPGDNRAKEALRQAERLNAVHFFCPEGGRYEVAADGKSCVCSVHGSAQTPRQLLAPAEAGAGKALQELGGATATLTFLEDGLHAIVVLERK